MRLHTRRILLPLLATCLGTTGKLCALEVLPADWPVRMSVSAMVDLETYYSDGLPPGLLFDDDEVFFNPRLTLFADLHFGNHLAGFVQARVDRGFDPGARADGDVPRRTAATGSVACQRATSR